MPQSSTPSLQHGYGRTASPAAAALAAATPTLEWPGVAMLREARRVARETGKSVPRQLTEIAMLRLGEGRLRPLHYYQFGLYDDRVYPWAVKREFIDWPATAIGDRVNDREWRAFAKDKIAFATLMRGAGLPHPRIVALFHPGGRDAGSGCSTASAQATADFLRTACYPLFGKPVYGRLGNGTALLEGYDAAADALRVAGGGSEPLESFVARIAARFARPGAGIAARSGYLFQEVLVPADEVAAISGRRVSTLRAVVLMHDEGPRLFRAVWRMPVGSNVADNFDNGRAGNITAHLDTASGVVVRAIRGLGTPTAGSDPRGPGALVRAHPDTGRELVGTQVPGWDRALALTLAAARTLPRIRFQSWDIALAAGGPAAIEVNYDGLLPQPGHLRGFLDPELRAFLARYGRRPGER